MKTGNKFLLASALGCAVVIGPGTARALSCATNAAQMPRDGERDVPTNTRIWAHGRFGGASAARLIGPEGEVAADEHFMPVAIAPGEGTNFPVLVPRAELEPNTSYAIEITYDYDEPNADATEQVRFTTGDGPATTPPPLPTLISTEEGAGTGWLGGGQRWLDLGFDLHGGMLIADTAAALGSVDSSDDLFVQDGSFDSVVVTPTARAIRWFSADDHIAVGEGDCLIWPEDGADRQSARFGVLDLAGNFSGWLTTEIELPSREEARAIIAAQQADEPAVADVAAPHYQERRTGCSPRVRRRRARQAGRAARRMDGRARGRAAQGSPRPSAARVNPRRPSAAASAGSTLAWIWLLA